jgi:hypothetical protein
MLEQLTKSLSNLFSTNNKAPETTPASTVTEEPTIHIICLADSLNIKAKEDFRRKILPRSRSTVGIDFTSINTNNASTYFWNYNGEYAISGAISHFLSTKKPFVVIVFAASVEEFGKMCEKYTIKDSSNVNFLIAGKLTGDLASIKQRYPDFKISALPESETIDCGKFAAFVDKNLTAILQPLKGDGSEQDSEEADGGLQPCKVSMGISNRN